MKKSLPILHGVLAFSLAAAAGWSDITVNFDGTYNAGVYDNWKTETDGWGDAPSPFAVIPGRGGAGNAQGMIVFNGCHYVVKTLAGLTPGQQYTVSVWIRTYYGDGSPGVPGSSSWVEFGWDPQARDTTQPNTNMVWCVDPKNDFANNAGNWVRYTGEAFTAVGDSVTIAFKVGSVDQTNGIMAQFDDLEIKQVVAPEEHFQFPDDFNTTFSLGVAYGWAKRFIPGGISPHWAEAPGRSGSAQRLYAGTEGANLAVNIGVVKVFDVEPDKVYRITLWISASDSSGTVLTDPNPDPGPVVKFGVDPTAQTDDPSTESIRWTTAPTAYFSVPGRENTWHQFTSPVFRATTDTVSVWLWVQGDANVGVDARFDDLDAMVLETLGTEHWKRYP